MTVAEWFADFFHLDGSADNGVAVEPTEQCVTMSTVRFTGVGGSLAAAVMFVTSVACIDLHYDNAQIASPCDVVAVPYVVPHSYDGWLDAVLNSPSETVVAALDWLA